MCCPSITYDEYGCLRRGNNAILVHKLGVKHQHLHDGVVLDINATCADLGDTVCSQLLGAHALSGCDIVSYRFGKDKASVLKTLKTGNFPGLFEVRSEESVTHEDIVAVGQQFFAALFGQPTVCSTTLARYNLYTRKQGKPLRIMLLSTTVTNHYLHVLTCRCLFGRQLNNKVLQMSASQSMVGK